VKSTRRWRQPRYSDSATRILRQGPKPMQIRQIEGPADGAIASHVRHEKINSFSQDNTPDCTLVLTTPLYSNTSNNPPQTSAMAT
jgi:hypothetical protein